MCCSVLYALLTVSVQLHTAQNIEHDMPPQTEKRGGIGGGGKREVGVGNRINVLKPSH